ncbi:hypothetical protein IJG14_01700 [bacterium]|nr:hypothetical protein [bacterium]
MEYNFHSFKNLTNCTINLPNEMTRSDKFTFNTVSNLFINNFQATNISGMFERDNFSNLPNFINFDNIRASSEAFNNSSITKLEDITFNINTVRFEYYNTFKTFYGSNKSFIFNNVNFPFGYSTFVANIYYKNIYFQNVTVNNQESYFSFVSTTENLIINDSYFEVNNFRVGNLIDSHNFTVKANNLAIASIGSSENFVIDSKEISNSYIWTDNLEVKNAIKLNNVRFFNIPYTERENILDMQNITVYNEVSFNGSIRDTTLNLPSAEFIGFNQWCTGNNSIPQDIYAPNNTIYSFIDIDAKAYNINFHQDYIYVNHLSKCRNLDNFPEMIVKVSTVRDSYFANLMNECYNTIHLTIDVENMSNITNRNIYNCKNATIYLNFVNVNQDYINFTLGSHSNAQAIYMNFGNITFKDFNYYCEDGMLERLSMFEGVQISNMLKFDLQYTNKLQESFGREFFEMLIRSKTNYPQLRLNQALNAIFSMAPNINESLYNEYPELNNLGIKW